MGLAILGDDDLLAGSGSRQELRETSSGFGDLVCGRWHDRISVSLLTATGEVISSALPE